MARAQRTRKAESWPPRRLDGAIAVVTGSSRGAGRGIALALGAAGATVYVTGRSVLGQTTTDDVPGTVEDTAEAVTARGGRGIPVRCDFTVIPEVEALFQRVQKEQGRLDILVNNVWGGYEGSNGLTPVWFWKASLKYWDTMFTAGLRAHILGSYFGIPLMLPQRKGLIVSTVAWNHGKYLGSFYDIAKHAIVRMIYGLARELRKFHIAAIAVAPGFTRTERVLKAFKTDEQHWRTVPGLKRTESPEYVGRGIVALATDPRVLRKSGRAFLAGELAREYRFTDVDGRRVPPFTGLKHFDQLLEQFEKKGRWE